MRRQTEIRCCVFAAGLLAASLALTQSVPATQSTQITPQQQIQQPQPDTQSPDSYLADSESLHQMALDLKQQVDKSSKDQLSLTVIRRATAVEKLAHSLRQRIRSDGGIQ